jgi:predicted Fe-Mo cluster-binding NifX family protein
MVVIITAKGAGLGAWVDDDFANCHQIVVVYDDGRFDAFSNPMIEKNQGKDLADFIVSRVPAVDTLVTGSIGKDALSALMKAGIKVYSAKKGSVLELVEMAKDRTLPLATP